MSYSNNIYVGPFLVVGSFGTEESKERFKICSKNKDHVDLSSNSPAQYCSICGEPLILSEPLILEKGFYEFCEENNIDDNDFYSPEFIGEEIKDCYFIIDEDSSYDSISDGLYILKQEDVLTENQMIIKYPKWKTFIELLKKNNVSYEYHFGVVSYQS